MRTYVYIDGFNFYYGCIKRTPFKWLDLCAFCDRSFPDQQIDHIRYFTAIVKSDASDPNRALRQQIYIRALETNPRLTVHLGQFLQTTKTGALIVPSIPGIRLGKVRIWEEKGSDVNIATHLLIDGFRDRFDQAVVISNDSDLAEPIKFVRDDLGLPVGVLSPHNSFGKPSYHLQKVATNYQSVDRTLLGTCQFPTSIVDRRGRTITKPSGW